MNQIQPEPYQDLKFNKHEDGFATFLIPKRYRIIKRLKSGSQGIVFYAHDTETDIGVAIKKLTRPFDSTANAERSYHEFSVLSVINHKNVAKLLSAYTPQETLENFNDIYFITEYMSKTLRDIIKDSTVLKTHELVSNFIYQILSGVEYLSDAKIAHRDLKPENIVVAQIKNNGYLLKIIDYGLSINQSITDMLAFDTTENYYAPEIVFEQIECNSKVDIWSVGCIFAEIITGRVLFDSGIPWLKVINTFGTPPKNFISQIKKNTFRKECYDKSGNKYKPKEWDQILPDEIFISIDQEFELGNKLIKLNVSMTREMISKMLKIDPDERYNVYEALKDPYVKFWKQNEKGKQNVRPIPFYTSIVENNSFKTTYDWKKALYDKLQFYINKHDVYANLNNLPNDNPSIWLINKSLICVGFKKLLDCFTQEIPDFNQNKTHFIQMYCNQPINTRSNRIFKKVRMFKQGHASQFGNKVLVKTVSFTNNNIKPFGFEFSSFNKDFNMLELKLRNISKLYCMWIFKPYNENAWAGKRFEYYNNLNDQVEIKKTRVIITPTSINIESNKQIVADIDNIKIDKVLIKECGKYFYLELYPSDYTHTLIYFCLVFVNSHVRKTCCKIKFKLIDKWPDDPTVVTPQMSSNLESRLILHVRHFSVLKPKEKIQLNNDTFYKTIVYEIDNPRLIPASKIVVKKLEKFEPYLREVHNLLMCKHKNIIKVFKCFNDLEHYYLAMEHLEGGSLHEYLVDYNKSLTISRAFNYLHQTLDGMCYLVEKGIMHRCLAACNCFLTDNYKSLKIGEFVFSRQANFSYHYNIIYNPVVPFRWMAIDFINGTSYNERMDVWSFAILAWEIFSREKQPYNELKQRQEVIDYLNKNERLIKPLYCPTQLHDLLKECWNSNYKLRPTFEQLQKNFCKINEELNRLGEENLRFGFAEEIKYVELATITRRVITL